MFAVGGNAEAARRAGINVNRIRVIVFSIASAMAAIGGILAASRLLAVNQSSGASDLLLLAIAGPVIAGTSLFGGRGSVWSALLGALVIGSISNGMDLLALESSVKFMVTGGVLLAAVIVDALARQAAPGRGESLSRDVVARGAGRLSGRPAPGCTLPLIARTDGMEVAAVVTSDPGRREAVARDHPGAEVLDGADAIWADPSRFDLVVVAAPNRAHADLAERSLREGLPVVVDKPLAVSTRRRRPAGGGRRRRRACRWPCSTTGAGTATSWPCASWRRRSGRWCAWRRAGSAGGPRSRASAGASRTPTPTAAGCCGTWAAT